MFTIPLFIAILLAGLWLLRRPRAIVQEPDAAALLAQLAIMEADFRRAEKEHRFHNREFRRLTRETNKATNAPTAPKPRKPREKATSEIAGAAASEPKDQSRYASLTRISSKKRVALEHFSQLLDQKYAANIAVPQPTPIVPTPTPQSPDRFSLFRYAKSCLTEIARPLYFGIRIARLQKLVLRASFIGWGAWGRVVAKDFVFRRNSSDNPPPADCVSVACESPCRIFSRFFRARPPIAAPPPQNQAA
jgi:hypothetical protein